MIEAIVIVHFVLCDDTILQFETSSTLKKPGTYLCKAEVVSYPDYFYGKETKAEEALHRLGSCLYLSSII